MRRWRYIRRAGLGFALGFDFLLGVAWPAPPLISGDENKQLIYVVAQIATHNDLTDLDFVSDMLGVKFIGENTFTSTGQIHETIYVPERNPSFLRAGTFLTYWTAAQRRNTDVIARLTIMQLQHSVCLHETDFDEVLLPKFPKHVNALTRYPSYTIYVSGVFHINITLDSSDKTQCVSLLQILEAKP